MRISNFFSRSCFRIRCPLITVHHDVISYLILILILVYWCLYKIIRDFNWYVFNRSEFIYYNLIFWFMQVEAYIRGGSMRFFNKFVYRCLYLYKLAEHFARPEIYPFLWNYGNSVSRFSRFTVCTSVELWIYRQLFIKQYVHFLHWFFLNLSLDDEQQ